MERGGYASTGQRRFAQTDWHAAIHLERCQMLNASTCGYGRRMKSFYIAMMQRLTGEKPSALRAAAGATAAGMATGVVVYRLLRHEADEG